jgi:hypothetical protein
VGKKRQRREKVDMVDEKQGLFDRVIDLKRAGIHQRHLFDFSFRTDGVGAFVMLRKPKKESDAVAAFCDMQAARTVRVLPTRGFWTTEQLRAATGLTLSQLYVIGIDPGKRDIIHCVDMDDQKKTLFRYTARQRSREMCLIQYRSAMRRAKPSGVREAEVTLAKFNSRTVDLDPFQQYVNNRLGSLDAALHFYGQLVWRQQRRKSFIKRQKSEEAVFSRFTKLRREHSDRLMVLSYGSWGMVAGRPFGRGLPPTLGVTFLRKLALRFLVCITPEQYTSQTCTECGARCGPWKELEAVRGNKVRGIRFCEECRTPLSRDRCGGCNIGRNFGRMYNSMTIPVDEDDAAILEADAEILAS